MKVKGRGPDRAGKEDGNQAELRKKAKARLSLGEEQDVSGPSWCFW